jgi:hypothetical protein
MGMTNGSDEGTTTLMVEATTDGGVTWHAESAPAGSFDEAYVYALSCPTLTNCFASGYGLPAVMETTNGSHSWTTVTPRVVPSARLDEIDCPSLSDCVATGASTHSPYPVIVSTRDVQGIGCQGSLPSGMAAGVATSADGGGYWLATSAGAVVSCGRAKFFGSLATRHVRPPTPIVAIAAADRGDGYYMLSKGGTVYAFGPGATYHGSAPPDSSVVVGMAVDPATGGYWLAGSNGGVYSFDAPFRGSLPRGRCPCRQRRGDHRRRLDRWLLARRR